MNSYQTGDTIAAPATAHGRAGIAVIRVSGTAAAMDAICQHMLQRQLLPDQRQSTFAPLRHVRDGEVIDKGLVTYFAAPKSYTGEHVMEFSVHGGMAIVEAVMDSLCALPDVRPAEPGEFTRRAFFNGKLDFSQSEAVADLIDAQTRAQVRQARRQLDGALGHQAETWREAILQAQAVLEAHIDFSDEDLPEDGHNLADGIVEKTYAEIEKSLLDQQLGEKIREGFVVAITGPPNVGKSSLLNSIAKRDLAIVHEKAGTTRDAIEAAVSLDGLLVTFVDTAGLRETEDAVELEGMRRTRARVEQADLVLSLAEPCGLNPSRNVGAEQSILVVNKVDEGVSIDKDVFLPGAHFISVLQNRGVDALLQDVCSRLTEGKSFDAAPVVTRQRHRHALQQCCGALASALECAEIEEKAEELRFAAFSLGKITGRTGVEDMLDTLFREFCIGK